MIYYASIESLFRQYDADRSATVDNLLQSLLAHIAIGYQLRLGLRGEFADRGYTFAYKAIVGTNGEIEHY